MKGSHRNRRRQPLLSTGKRHRRYTSAFLAGAAVLVLSAGAYAWYVQPHAADVAYQPCRIDYGQVVAEWDGQGNRSWNRDGYHYQTRRFRVRAHAPDTRFPNTIESPPTRIATGGPHDCDPEFDETVDPASDTYRWQGARATGIRLGVPGTTPEAETALLTGPTTENPSSMATPVYNNPASAAVWVDDGGSASLKTGGETHRWWCVNHRPCQDITRQTGDPGPLRGAGYQYVGDNCPEHASCNNQWRTPSVPGRIGRERDLLTPFKLRLSAVSTYADTVGASMAATFRYPRTVSMETAVSGEANYLRPEDEVSVDLTLRKHGPSLDSVRIIPEAGGQPISGLSPRKLDTSRRERLNKTDAVTFPVSFSLTQTAEPGTCYSLPLRIHGNGAEAALARPEVTYCLAAPARRVTYSVRTRGEITTDVTQFRNQVARTLSDRRGWAATNVVFDRVPRGGDFTLWLASPAATSGFSSGCDATYSCRVGGDVIINDARWRDGTPAWNRSGGSLRDYRHMVINHEVGHFLGLGHRRCPQPGTKAPIMMQQSIDLGGCRFNPWPLPAELESLS